MDNPDDDFKMNLIKHHGLYRDIDNYYEFKDEATKLALFEFVNDLELWEELERLLYVERGGFSFKLVGGVVFALYAISKRERLLLKPISLDFPYLKSLTLEFPKLEKLNKDFIDGLNFSEIEYLTLNIPIKDFNPKYLEKLQNLKRFHLEFRNLEKDNFDLDVDIKPEFKILKYLTIIVKNFNYLPKFIYRIINNSNNLEYFIFEIIDTEVNKIILPKVVTNIELTIYQSKLNTIIPSNSNIETLHITLDGYSLMNSKKGFLSNINNIKNLYIGNFPLNLESKLSDFEKFFEEKINISNEVKFEVCILDSLEILNNISSKEIKIFCQEVYENLDFNDYKNLEVTIY